MANKLFNPVWYPTDRFVKTTNIAHLMHKLNFDDYQLFYKWSVSHYPEFWETIVKELNIIFSKPYQSIIDLSDGIESPHWFLDAKLNIINSCFQANDNDIAIIEQMPDGTIKKISYRELDKLVNRIANSLSQYLKPKDRVAIVMPMTSFAVAIYLGVIKAGLCAVTIADSFSANEISKRLRITNAKAVFTQGCIINHDQHLPLYEKIIDANAPFTIVLPLMKKHKVRPLRKQDMKWDVFLDDKEVFQAIVCEPDDHTNILFSSDTTGDPKAIPWTHTTPIKCASDGYLYQNIKSKDIICWPTNLGWMGPWLVYAALINKATIALYDGPTNERNFGKFIERMKVTILGVTPTLIKQWRQSICMEGLDWSAIKLFTSTGGCSNSEDVLYLLSLNNCNSPMIEYCGGAEIGGAYLTGTVIHPCVPSLFTTKALGLSFKIIDEAALPATNGEVALIPPSIGLSTDILNKNHHQIYYAHMPTLPAGVTLRRQGDHIEQLQNGMYRLLGRIDDTMNLHATHQSEKKSPNKLTQAVKVCLALQGGGAYGAYTWGILDRLLEDERIEIDAISATSAGSVNAVLLAQGMMINGRKGAREALGHFWETLSQHTTFFDLIRQIFPANNIFLEKDYFAQTVFLWFDLMTRIFSPYILNPFNFDLLRSILLSQIDFDNLRKNSKIHLFLCATNVKTGLLQVFETEEITVDVVRASSCLPQFNHAVKIKDDFYWDGGYLGNPAIYPLIYNSQVDDIIIIHNNPIFRDSIPITSTDIVSRENEISFNSSLIRELRAISFITKLIDKGWIKEEYRDKLRRKSMHIVRSDEIMNQFKLINKYNWQWYYINHLYDLGRKVAEDWLKDNFKHLGKKPTIDFTEFLGNDSQTS